MKDYGSCQQNIGITYVNLTNRYYNNSFQDNYIIYTETIYCDNNYMYSCSCIFCMVYLSFCRVKVDLRAAYLLT